MKNKYSFEVFWYPNDNAYIARLNDPHDFASLSWIDIDPVKALKGLIELLEDAEKDSEIKNIKGHIETNINKRQGKIR